MNRILFSLFLVLTLFFSFVGISYCEIDKTTVVSRVIDGDTFDATSGDRIRLADIDAPESGEYGHTDAKKSLTSLLYEKTVYLDIDDIYETDRYGRLVCVVYVDYNSTHLMNVNEMLLIAGDAVISDYHNEFDPFTWNLFVPKKSGGYSTPIRYSLLIVAAVVAMIMISASFAYIWKMSEMEKPSVVSEVESQKKRPAGLAIITVLWLLGGIFTIYVVTQAVSADLETLSMLSGSLAQILPECYKFGVEAELGINIIATAGAIVQLVTIYGLWTGKPWSYKLAPTVPILIVSSHTLSAALYLSAPPELGLQEFINWVPLAYSSL